MRLLVGLGNPGPKYADTRHNAGFMALDLLARRHAINISQQRFLSLIGSGLMAGEKVLLAQPQTFMNLSGLTVSRIMNYFRLDLDQLIVLHDDLDIELGRIKVAAGGGAGGHKGVASIIESLGESKFARIKIGIGRAPQGQSGEDYVLSLFAPEEMELVREALEKAASAAEVWVSEGAAKAQVLFNRKERNVKEEVKV